MRQHYLLIISFLLVPCLKSGQHQHLDSAKKRSILEELDWSYIEKLYENRGITECFILHDLEKGTIWIYNAERARKEYLPSSRFKIPNSSIALECGANANENEIIKWDRVTRFVTALNADHNLATAFRYSCLVLPGIS